MDKRLNLSQIAELLAGRSGMTKANAERFVKSFFDIISDSVASGETVRIKGLGTFKTVMVEDRESVNVNTGERFVIQGYRKVNFLPEASLKEEINKPFSAFETVILSDSPWSPELRKRRIRDPRSPELRTTWIILRRLSRRLRLLLFPDLKPLLFLKP